jgi:conjugal transfer/entry exclusion protein
MKTERVTLLTTPDFKSFLAREAKREKISVAELVRKRCAGRVSSDDSTLAELTSELRKAIGAAHASVADGIETMQSTLAELREARTRRTRPTTRIKATA